ncbi:DUF2691 family protein [Bacillus sp. UMB0728]|uniref:DUF2691 family protein n=1 Tax=Bacillus sp. UMB0728 TaxID=2066052 RepID=UPI000C7709FB|nr:DUF2691 family protein [Bacillus sp. UMB0728]PLR71176.1 hypothetical protein CYJ37_20600 [Bacillus sp. UMB0728]
MKRGITFEIPNEYGRFLFEILLALEASSFEWVIAGEEGYFIENGELGRELFPENKMVMAGEELLAYLHPCSCYLIFADLKAFPPGKAAGDIKTYKDFLKSDCRMAIMIVDCSDVAVYCKDRERTERMYRFCKERFLNAEYITDENDGRSELAVW